MSSRVDILEGHDISLPINASDVVITEGETLEDWVINSSEFIPDMVSEQVEIKIEEFKNTLDPTIEQLKYETSINADSRCRKLVGVGNIKVETGLEITSAYLLGGYHLNAITYGLERFFSVGNYGMYTQFPNNNIGGVSWSNLHFSTTKKLYGVAYGNKLFVAVGEEGTLIRCTLAGSYNIANISNPCDLTNITYGNNQFIIVGVGGKIIVYSPNTGSLISRTPPKTFDMRGVVYGMDTTTGT
jgi:hypothetical protein